MLRDVEEMAGKLGKGASCQTYRAYVKLAAAFREALEEEELEAAAEARDGLAKMSDLSPIMKEEIKPLNERMIEIGRMQIEEAVENADQHPKIAKEILRELSKVFKGTPLEKEIRAARKRIRR